MGKFASARISRSSQRARHRRRAVPVKGAATAPNPQAVASPPRKSLIGELLRRRVAGLVDAVLDGTVLARNAQHRGGVRCWCRVSRHRRLVKVLGGAQHNSELLNGVAKHRSSSPASNGVKKVAAWRQTGAAHTGDAAGRYRSFVTAVHRSPEACASHFHSGASSRPSARTHRNARASPGPRTGRPLRWWSVVNVCTVRKPPVHGSHHGDRPARRGRRKARLSAPNRFCTGCGAAAHHAERSAAPVSPIRQLRAFVGQAVAVLCGFACCSAWG